MNSCYIEKEDMVMVYDSIKMLRDFCDKEGHYPRNTGGYYSIDDATNFLTKYFEIMEKNNE